MNKHIFRICCSGNGYDDIIYYLLHPANRELRCWLRDHDVEPSNEIVMKFIFQVADRLEYYGTHFVGMEKMLGDTDHFDLCDIFIYDHWLDLTSSVHNLIIRRLS